MPTDQSFQRYAIPGIIGAAIAFGIRLIFASLDVAVIGLVVFAIVYGVILLLARALNWQDSPMLYAGVSAVAVTLAFLITRQAP